MFKSASKIAFLLITLSLCIFTALGIVEATDFIALATGVLAIISEDETNHHNKYVRN